MGPGPSLSLATESKFQVHQITSGDQTRVRSCDHDPLMTPLIAGVAPDEAGQMTRARSVE